MQRAAAVPRAAPKRKASPQSKSTTKPRDSAAKASPDLKRSSTGSRSAPANKIGSELSKLGKSYARASDSAARVKPLPSPPPSSKFLSSEEERELIKTIKGMELTAEDILDLGTLSAEQKAEIRRFATDVDHEEGPDDDKKKK